MLTRCLLLPPCSRGSWISSRAHDEHVGLREGVTLRASGWTNQLAHRTQAVEAGRPAGVITGRAPPQLSPSSRWGFGRHMAALQSGAASMAWTRGIRQTTRPPVDEGAHPRRSSSSWVCGSNPTCSYLASDGSRSLVGEVLGVPGAAFPKPLHGADARDARRRSLPPCTTGALPDSQHAIRYPRDPRSDQLPFRRARFRECGFGVG
jgi:hypothetical protein